MRDATVDRAEQRVRGDHLARQSDAEHAGSADAELSLVRARRWPPRSSVQRGARRRRRLARSRRSAQFRLLCAHRRGPYGVSTWTSRLQAWLAARLGDLDLEQRDYVGRPLLVTENDYELGLYNGDTGVIVQSSNEPASAVFERGGELLQLQPAAARCRRDRLRDDDPQEPGLAVRHGRGPAAAELPDPHQRAALYGRHARPPRLILVATEDALAAAVQRPVARASGLRRRLWGDQ